MDKHKDSTYIGKRKELKRSSNLELFRIISMAAIIAHHFVVNSGITSSWSPVFENAMSWRSLFFVVFGAWGKVGINCFVLITGYFMCEKQISTRKFFRLAFEVILYNIIIYIVFLFFGYEEITLSRILSIILPIKDIDDGFVSCFLMFYLFIPFINILIHNMTKGQHFRLTILLVFIYSVLGSVKYVTVAINLVSWFMTVYLVASYIRLYGAPWFHDNKIVVPLCLMSFGLSCATIINSMHYVAVNNEGVPIYYWVNDANKILALTTAVTLFLIFRNIQIPQVRIINVFAASAFGVLCIHANSDAMREWLWQKIVNVERIYFSKYFSVIAVGWVLLIYFVCALIDMCRVKLIENPILKAVDKSLKKESLIARVYDGVDKWFQGRI